LESVGTPEYKQLMTYQKKQFYKVKFRLTYYVPEGGRVSIILPERVNIETNPFEEDGA